MSLGPDLTSNVVQPISMFEGITEQVMDGSSILPSSSHFHFNSINLMTKEYLSPEYKESLRERADRHEAHQAMIEEHKQRKALARERHRKHWHKFKAIPINFI